MILYFNGPWPLPFPTTGYGCKSVFLYTAIAIIKKIFLDSHSHPPNFLSLLNLFSIKINHWLKFLQNILSCLDQINNNLYLVTPCLYVVVFLHCYFDKWFQIDENWYRCSSRHTYTLIELFQYDCVGKINHQAHIDIGHF